MLEIHSNEWINQPKDSIFIFNDITPSQINLLASNGFKAYISIHGSVNSHSSILSRAFNLTALTALETSLDSFTNGQIAIIDGMKGNCIINPDSSTIAYYEQIFTQIQSNSVSQMDLAKLPNTTKEGIHIQLMCNIEIPQEIDKIIETRCDGIGLFRTEFLFLDRDSFPSEEEQFTIYKSIIEKMDGRPVTIRTFDLGGDKFSHFLQMQKEDNPYLGCRGIRFSLSLIEMFKAQLRSIIRASKYGNVKIMFPMVIGVEDFLAAKVVVMQCYQELIEQSYNPIPNIPLGVMIEIPAAALCSNELAQHCDFFSIGTNDLVQYTLAVDRNNESMSGYYIQHHPAVLKLINQTLISAATHHIPVSICGEMASTPEYIPLLMGMGVTEFSINTSSYFKVKSVIKKCDKKLYKLCNANNIETLVQVEDLVFNKLKPYYHT